MQGFKPRDQRDSQSKKQSKHKKANIGFANGGMIRGPGTGTSDDIEAEMPAGSYVMPADSTEQIGAQGLAGLGAPADVNVSNGEYQLPPEQVHAVGVQALDQMKDQTHVPVAKGFNPQVNRDGEQFFNQGGVTLGDEEAKRKAAQMQNRQPMAQQPQQLRLPAPQPQPIVHPQPNPAFDTYGRGDFTAADQTRANAKADTARWQAERAAQDSRPANTQAQPKTKPARIKAGFGSKAAGFASALPEALDVYDVAMDKGSTGFDVATQASEGIGRTAATIGGAAVGAKTGAAVGAFGGPFAPITVPLGTAIGGLSGGALGYWGAGKAIEAGREAVGVDPASPIERLQSNQAVPVQHSETAPQAAVPLQPEQSSQSVQDSQTIQQPAQQMQMQNDITRVGNSFSAQGPIREGYTVNGQAQGQTNITQAPQSAQNQQAVANLLERTPEFGAGAGAAGYQPNSAFAMPQQNGPRVTVVGDGAQAERERRQLWNAASTAHKGAQNGQLTAAQMNTMRGLKNDERTDATSQRNTDANNAAALAREGMSQAGANQRQSMNSADQNKRTSLDERKFSADQNAQGFSLRAAERAEKAYERYENAKTPEEKSAALENLSAVRGDRESNQNLSNNFMKIKVPETDAEGRVIGEREELVDLRTLNQQSQQMQAPQKGQERNGYRFKGGDPSSQKNWEKI